MAKRRATAQITTAWRVLAKQLTEELVQLKNRMGAARLYRTMHKLDAACQEIGWEIADILTGKQAGGKE
jgi:hypothetical protein